MVSKQRSKASFRPCSRGDLIGAQIALRRSMALTPAAIGGTSSEDLVEMAKQRLTQGDDDLARAEMAKAMAKDASKAGNQGKDGAKDAGNSQGSPGTQADAGSGDGGL